MELQKYLIIIYLRFFFSQGGSMPLDDSFEETGYYNQSGSGGRGTGSSSGSSSSREVLEGLEVSNASLKYQS